MQITDLIKKYKKKLDVLDIELLIAHSLGKPREFVLAHPEKTITEKQEAVIKKLIGRRISKEPIAYITGHKEFYGLDFIINKHTLIPRPETELLVDLVIRETRTGNQELCIIDIGTGSGNIIISIVEELRNNRVVSNLIQKPETPKQVPQNNFFSDSRFHENDKFEYFATDISKEALKIAKKNSKIHGTDKKIKFLYGNLLDPIFKAMKRKPAKLIIMANLPYLSREIYSSTSVDVKKYEPKSALYSSEKGLCHYRNLLLQIKKSLLAVPCPSFVVLEISPEQKIPFARMVKKFFPKADFKFKKDLAKKWRACEIQIP